MDGFINVYKEGQMTSFDVVAIIRRILKIKRVGHAGTLDPMAKGVLPISIGRAGRLIEYLHDEDKEYGGTFILGYETDSLDVTGNVTEVSDINSIEAEIIKKKFSEFIGLQDQMTPAYSAVKVNGKKLYEYARAGIEIERPVRKIEIKSLISTASDGHETSFICSCSKGTYIRQLVADIGRSLGSLATLSALERRAVGPFRFEEAIPISKIKLMDREELERYILPLDYAIKNLTRLDLTSALASRAKNGQIIKLNRPISGGTYRVYEDNGNFIGIGLVNNDSLKMKKVFL